MKNKINLKEIATSFLLVFLFCVAHSADQIYERAKENPFCFMATISVVLVFLLVMKIINKKREERGGVYINR